jgi:hypothetical protein
LPAVKGGAFGGLDISKGDRREAAAQRSVGLSTIVMGVQGFS